MLHTAKARVASFVVLVTAISAIANHYISRGVFGHAGSLAYMWCPALAAIVASIVTRRPFKAIGWRPHFKWMGLAWLIPIVCGFLVYGTVWLTGMAAVPRNTFLERARLNLKLSATQPDWLVIVAAFFFITVPLLLPSMISALGEEIGWRGFLVPELTNWLGFRGACLVSGVVWTLWHLPAIIFGGYGGSGTPKTYQTACFAAMVMSSAVVMAWLRMRSGSVWPPVVMHAAHNAAIQLFFDRITADGPRTAYIVGEFGIGLVVPLTIVAIYALQDMSRTRSRNVEGISVFTQPCPEVESA